MKAPPPALAIPAILLGACGAAPSGPAAGNASAADRNAAEYRAAAEEARVNSQPADLPLPPVAGEPRVDALLAALAARDEAAARRLVGDVGYIVATDGIVSSEDAFIARVLGCETADVRTVNAPVRYRIVWTCPEAGTSNRVYYNAAIATGPPFATANGPVTILEFSAGRTNPALGRGNPPPMITRRPGN